MILPTHPPRSGPYGGGVRPCFDLQNQNSVFVKKEEWVLPAPCAVYTNKHLQIILYLSNIFHAKPYCRHV